MEVLSRLSSTLADGRLGANLIAVHGVITLTVIVSLTLRRLVNKGSTRLAGWTGLRWLESAGEEAARRVQALLFRLTLIGIALTLLAGISYHALGRDIRHDSAGWY